MVRRPLRGLRLVSFKPAFGSASECSSSASLEELLRSLMERLEEDVGRGLEPMTVNTVTNQIPHRLGTGDAVYSMSHRCSQSG